MKKFDWKKRLLRALIVGLIIWAVVFAARRLHVADKVIALASWLRGAGPLGAALFVVSYIVGSVFAAPIALVSGIAGYAYGPFYGVLIALPSVTMGATAAFFVGRKLGRRRVEALARKYVVLGAIANVIGENGLRMVCLLRLAVVLPENLLPYGIALSPVRTRDFVIGTFVGLFPLTCMHVYVGSLVTDAAQLLSGGEAPSKGRIAMVVIGLVVSLVAIAIVARAARREVMRALEAQKANKEVMVE